MSRKTMKYVTATDIEEIVDAPVPAFELQSVAKRTSLLRLVADTLDRSQPETVENIRLAHLLASWANELDATLAGDSLCDCGKPRKQCVCDQQAAEHYLATGDASHLIGLGWHRDVLQDLSNGEVSPAALLSAGERNIYQKCATPADLRHQSL